MGIGTSIGRYYENEMAMMQDVYSTFRRSNKIEDRRDDPEDTNQYIADIDYSKVKPATQLGVDAGVNDVEGALNKSIDYGDDIMQEAARDALKPKDDVIGTLIDKLNTKDLKKMEEDTLSKSKVFPAANLGNSPAEVMEGVEGAKSRVSGFSNMTDVQMRARLGQLLRDKAATKKAGGDVESSDYMHYNSQIRELRELLKTQ